MEICDSDPATINPAFKNSHRILVCLRYGIGDVVMETPVLETLRKASPQATIVAMGVYPALDLLRNDPRVDILFDVKQWGLSHWYDWGNERIEQEIHTWLDENRFDLILDISHAIIAVRNAIWRYARATLLDTNIEAQDESLSKGEQGQGALRRGIEYGWGLPVPSHLRPFIYPGEGALHFAGQFIMDNALTDKRLAGASIEASSPLKQWPLERVTQVLNKTIKNSDVHILLFAAPSDSQVYQLIRNIGKNRRHISLVKTENLRNIAALLRQCNAFLCNDTGLMHMADAVGTPVTALFGPTHPALYLPAHAQAGAFGGWTIPCPYRKTTSFGPPLCICLGSCMIDSGSCIDRESTVDIVAREFKKIIDTSNEKKGHYDFKKSTLSQPNTGSERIGKSVF
ncbi:MAG: hypothetical protein GF401_09005 [Chitinivibrionales bacterium]|nr:hypothetical protein [Chitinivibrionales bacterium]